MELQRSKSVARQKLNEGLMQKDICRPRLWLRVKREVLFSFPIRVGSGVPARNASDITASWKQSNWGRQSVPPVTPPTSWVLPSTEFTASKKKKNLFPGNWAKTKA